MGVRLNPTDSIFGASLGQQQLAAVEAHLKVDCFRESSALPGVLAWLMCCSYRCCQCGAPCI